MIRVLWITTRIFEETDEKSSGVWLKALADLLLETNKIELANVSVKSGISKVQQLKYKSIAQWILPYEKSTIWSSEKLKTERYLLSVLEQFNPDIIHVWGSENPFKILPFYLKSKAKIVFSLQGVLGSMGPNTLKGMSVFEMISTLGIREFVKGKSIFSDALSFYRAGKVEEEMVRHSDFIITQSDWTDSQIININPKAKRFKTHRVIRNSFLTCEKWYNVTRNEQLVFTSAYGYSWKGLHIFFKAMSIVVEKYPNVKIIVAGKIGRVDLFGQGYLRMMMRFIKHNNFEKNVFWVGSLSEHQLVKVLQDALVYVNPSFVESYSNAVAEALLVGTPSVISFSGALPERAANNVEALFFSPGDYKYCAHQVIRLIEDTSLALTLSRNSVKRAFNDYNPKQTCENQLAIYSEILK